MNFSFDPDILNTIAGGRSTLEMRRLQIFNLEAAQSFIKTYGFDLDDQNHLETLWQQHRRALVLMTEKLGFVESEIPPEVRDRKVLQDIRLLLLYASRTGSDPIQKWACAVLRCMHVFIHAENDLFSFFANEIQDQILSSYEPFISTQGQSVFLTGKVYSANRIQLEHFQPKPFKTTSSAVLKLLARPDALAMRVFDKIGIRFVTKSVLDSFRVIQFLVQENMVSFPHIMPDQSSNNVYPVELFLEVCEKIKKTKLKNDDEIQNLFKDELKKTGDTALFRKLNEHSDLNFKFIKFISRQMIRVKTDNNASGFHFFYPYEVQIMDEESFLATTRGPLEHNAYKNRQRQSARARVMPDEVIPK